MLQDSQDFSEKISISVDNILKRRLKDVSFEDIKRYGRILTDENGSKYVFCGKPLLEIRYSQDGNKIFADVIEIPELE